MLDYTNAFFASHDNSRRFSGANIRIFLLPMPKKNKVLGKITVNKLITKKYFSANIVN